MAISGVGLQKHMSDINLELGRSSTAEISLAAAATGTYATINTSSPSYPNNTTPHGMDEWAGYDHDFSAGATDITGASLANSYMPGDGGGSTDVSFTLDSAIGGSYVTIEVILTGGDPITNTGSQGVDGPFTSSPQTINIVAGAGASGYAVVRLYNSGNTLLDTYTTTDTPLPT